MTTNDIELSVHDEGSGGRPQPTYNWSQAKQGGLTTHKIFMLIIHIWRMVIIYHLQARTPRDRWEPTEDAGHLLGTHYNDEAAEQLERACVEQIDAPVREIEDLGVEIDSTVQQLAERDAKVTSPETGSVYTEAEAVTRVERNQAKIEADVERGQAHHRRVPRWFRWLGKGSPYGEALGLIVFLTFVLNVEWTNPIADPLTWTLSIVVVLATLLFTPRVVERAGDGWNKRREAIAERQLEAARRATRRLAVNGVIATVVSLVIVAGLVERALAVTDDSLTESMLALIIALCVIAGLAMPAIAFLAVAWDGSSISRENEGLVKQLDAGLAEDQGLRNEARSLDQTCAQKELHVGTELAPAALRIVVEIAEEMRRAYAWLRVQIGGLPSAPPARPIQDLNGAETHSIDTGIPGAEPIRLQPLLTRGLRLKELQRRRQAAMTALEQMPPHPWSGNQEVA